MKSSVKYFFVLVISFTVQHSLLNCALAQAPRPNILLIVTDDQKWNSLTIMDSTYMLPTPNIDRIGHEGANIKYYSTNSLCIPGRAALVSGKYGHRTGNMSNHTMLSNNAIMLPKLLHNNGYYTALIGKWMLNPWLQSPDFDYWLKGPSGSDHWNDSMYYGNTKYGTTGHIVDVETDSALQLISRIDTPFFLMLSYNSPHRPWSAQTPFIHLCDSVDFLLPENFAPYTQHYPSVMYNDSGFIISTEDVFQYYMRGYSEMIAGIDESVGKIMDSVEARNFLNNTMVIFTTDNGFLIGEHFLIGKYRPYNDCMRMPLLIRYPAWFPAGTVMDNNFALNIDMLPTLLDAAGVTDTIVCDGISIHDFYLNQNTRQKFLYEEAPDDTFYPFIRVFRDNYFQYTKYFCTDTTEELFNEQEDPLQLINLVEDPLYQNVLYQYRIKLDSIRLALDDTIPISPTPCYLRSDTLTGHPDLANNGFNIFPNPTQGILYIQSDSNVNADLELFNVLGERITMGELQFSKSKLQNINLHSLADGLYFIRIQNAEKYFTTRIIKVY